MIVREPTLDLAPIGNCSASALIDREARLIWACVPRFDSDPMFSNLLTDVHPSDEHAEGMWSIEMEDLAEARQEYVRNTAILRTELTDSRGQSIEILDFCPRYHHLGRTYRPTAFVRKIKPISGAPRITVRLRPMRDWGDRPAQRTWGSNHVRYEGSELILRLTTNCPVSHVLEERAFRLEKELAFFLGPDEAFSSDVIAGVDLMLRETESHWREWVRTLTVPLDYQAVVIRAAITLKLCCYEETGAIIAALTTSIPEAPNSGRNWDYRYCWIRDAYYVLQALNRLGAADILENYLSYLRNLVDEAKGGHVQPVYGVGLEPAIGERIIESLPGYAGMGPVRAGNQAHEHHQHDVYGQIILPSVQAFFDQRLMRPGTVQDFEALEQVGERAFAVHDQPDAGLWELRTRARIHTYSSLMCWAACDRLSKAAEVLGLLKKRDYWGKRAAEIHKKIDTRAWNDELGHFVASYDGSELDASLIQLVELRFVEPSDPRYLATLEALEKDLRRGSYFLRYSEPDDFGEPETAFNFCTFWFIEALHLAGRADEARVLFEEMLSRRSHAGLLSEDLALEDGRLWGNYPQTYSLVGLINCAAILSRPWTAVR